MRALWQALGLLCPDVAIVLLFVSPAGHDLSKPHHVR